MSGLRQVGCPDVHGHAARGRQEPGDHVQDGRLARAVGAEQAGDARADRHRDVVDRDDVAVPAADVVEVDAVMEARLPVAGDQAVQARATRATRTRAYTAPKAPGLGTTSAVRPAEPQAARRPSA